MYHVPYDDMVLCQYRDITQRSNVKRQLEQVNRNLREIQKVAQIGQWMYNTRDNVFHYMGYTGVLCEESSRSISLEKYQEFIVEEDRLSFTSWCRKMRKDSRRKYQLSGPCRRRDLLYAPSGLSARRTTERQLQHRRLHPEHH